MSPLTRLVSRAWYGIRHLTTPLRSIHLPVESPRKVGALESPTPTDKASWVAFRSVGVALACAWPEASSTSSSATSKSSSDGESGIWVSVSHQQMDTEPCKQASLQLRLNDETPVFPTVLYLSLAHKASVRTITTSPGCRVTAPALRS